MSIVERIEIVMAALLATALLVDTLRNALATYRPGPKGEVKA